MDEVGGEIAEGVGYDEGEDDEYQAGQAALQFYVVFHLLSLVSSLWMRWRIAVCRCSFLGRKASVGMRARMFLMAR